MTSQVSQNFHAECEAAVNQLVNLELWASYVYLSMACHFDRDDVALSHAVKFFKQQSYEEREHAEKFLRYQNKRGGRLVLKDIKKPEQDEWGNILEALQKALQLEKTVNQALLDLHKLATEKADPHKAAWMGEGVQAHLCPAQTGAGLRVSAFVNNFLRSRGPTHTCTFLHHVTPLLRNK